jgi:hypothetical protein
VKRGKKKCRKKGAAERARRRERRKARRRERVEDRPPEERERREQAHIERVLRGESALYRLTAPAREKGDQFLVRAQKAAKQRNQRARKAGLPYG